MLTIGTTLSSLAVAQAPGQTALPSPEIYTCIDAHGRKLTSDRPIAACRDREQKILNPSGTVKARVGPTLTAKEQAQRDAKARADLAERTRIEEERRQDRALLIRYPNPAAHEKERAEALDNINRSKQTALTRTTELLAQRSKLTDEMAFYEKDPSKAPPQLQHQYQEVNQALAVQGRLLAEFDAQLIRIKTRFDTELNRLIPLWNQVSKSID
ncbi:MAG: DUF4124 domain-containing protein [Comamonadaceae bacterium CG_4_9_14_0_8_um_filter_60_18]|nr:MAG: DUF4124 domain-containing protein [Comamonadaceae bacterium CG_4_9_14_0_8_um_filter_60_18]